MCTLILQWKHDKNNKTNPSPVESQSTPSEPQSIVPESQSDGIEQPQNQTVLEMVPTAGKGKRVFIRVNFHIDKTDTKEDPFATCRESI